MPNIEEKTVTAFCPLCQTLIPIVNITFIKKSWLHKNVKIEIDGDATDYITHMWAHQQGIIDPT